MSKNRVFRFYVHLKTLLPGAYYWRGLYGVFKTTIALFLRDIIDNRKD